MMKPYDRICPLCRQMNRNLYLDETGGFMECERCKEISYVLYPLEDEPDSKTVLGLNRIRSLLSGAEAAAAGFGKTVRA